MGVKFLNEAILSESRDMCLLMREIYRGISLRFTMAYRVFYHDLLITKLHHIDYENYTDGIHHPKDMLHGFQKI